MPRSGTSARAGWSAAASSTRNARRPVAARIGVAAQGVGGGVDRAALRPQHRAWRRRATYSALASCGSASDSSSSTAAPTASMVRAPLSVAARACRWRICSNERRPRAAIDSPCVRRAESCSSASVMRSLPSRFASYSAASAAASRSRIVSPSSGNCAIPSEQRELPAVQVVGRQRPLQAPADRPRVRLRRGRQQQRELLAADAVGAVVRAHAAVEQRRRPGAARRRRPRGHGGR